MRGRSLTDRTPDARVDPWLIVELPDGAELLFGFGWHHPITGGLSWMRSSPVIDLDEETGRARTASGRIYELGRRIPVEGLPEEGRAALELLILKPEGLLQSESERDAATAAWLVACKWARHCRAQPPPRDDLDAIQKFMREYADMYEAVRSGRPR